jgi:hypothetical protein
MFRPRSMMLKLTMLSALGFLFVAASSQTRAQKAKITLKHSCEVTSCPTGVVTGTWIDDNGFFLNGPCLMSLFQPTYLSCQPDPNWNCGGIGPDNPNPVFNTCYGTLIVNNFTYDCWVDYENCGSTIIPPDPARK